MASQIPGPGFVTGPSRLGQQSQRSISSSRLPSRKPVPDPKIPKPTLLTKRKPVSKEPQKSSVPRTAPTKREPPAPRPVIGNGRGFVGTSMPPPSSFRQDFHDSDGNMQPPIKVALFEPARTPSLVSGSSAASTADSPRSNIIKRKDIFARGARNSPDSTSSEERRRLEAAQDEDMYADAVFGISLPPTQSLLAAKSPDDAIINLDRFITQPPLITHDLPPSASQYTLSASPSTHYSPGPFSISSTPTSASCYSPGVISTGPRPSLNIPREDSYSSVRPTSSRKVTNESFASTKESSTLAPVRQSSSSSGSTVRAGEDGGKLRSPERNQTTSPRNRLIRPKPRLTAPTESQTGRRSPTRHPKVLPTRPPEFAHLEKASPVKRVLTQRPQRPSRDGTPEINFKEASPVIQSNLMSLPSSFHRRQDSAESRKGSIGSGSSAEVKSRFGIPRKPPSRNPSPSPVSPAMVQPIARAATPELTSENEKQHKTKASPNPERSQSRFGFFKRSKTEPPPPAAPKDKRLRKGPVAGTGHEGYGKFGTRGRSGSTTSGNTSVGRSSSADSGPRNVTQPSSRKNSVGSTGSDVDDFLAERINPITLRGTGSVSHGDRKVSGNPDQRTDRANAVNSSTVNPARPSAIDKATGSRPLLPSPNIDSVSESVDSGESTRNGSASTLEQKDHRFGLSRLASKRASRHSMVETKPATELQEQLFSNYHFPTHPVIDPLDRKLSEFSAPVRMLSTSSAALGPNRADTQPKVAAKSTRKWNFLWANKAATKKDETAMDTAGFSGHKSAAPRMVPHYAIGDTPDNIDDFDLEKIMQEAEDINERSPINLDDVEDSQLVPRHGNSILLPEPPPFIPEFALHTRSESPRVALQTPVVELERDFPEPALPQVTMESPPLHAEVPNSRPSRLPQVGRIPRVVSKRERQKKPSISSFSRPFDSTQPSPAIQSPRLEDDSMDGDTFNNAHFTPADFQYSRPLLPTTMLYTASPESFHGPVPFLEYPRKNSGLSNVSSSPGQMALGGPTLVPSPRAPSGFDDVWSEYDDLIDLLAPQTPKTPHTGSSFGAPFQYSSLASPVEARYADMPSPHHMSIPSVPYIMRQMRAASVRESQVLTPYANTATPNSIVSVSDFLATYGDRAAGMMDTLASMTSAANTPRIGLSTLEENSENSSVTPQPVVSAAEAPRSRKARDSVSMQLVEAQHMGFETMANLRFSALMTSKWLSFGRVLFSPAHFEMKNAREDRILVIDGLGKDWSFYIALNYSNAMVYNIGTEATDSATTKTGSLESPSNHRHIQHPSLNAPFPFPKGFFAAVVFRFPIVTSDSAYRFAISECKRVLRPGGHLEISVLDMDMLNMGNHARRALRSLKERINAVDSSTSLKSISDTMQRMLGRRGFENLNRCFVGVPAAGSLPNASEGSSQQSPASGSPVTNAFKRQTMPSFGDLLRDQSVSGDDGITQMVGRVARWWYSRCYESLVLADGDMTQSIWADDNLLKECEMRGTSIRLMVCHAQKPDCPVRRTISV
ncbi:hypothetical protein BT63DRAFT_110073 [Microthyrium microscopicum]|uniref:Methyltransferase type 11 domain-containing protein n=1 Tax=Microthyrium microscopicum TaxID=703497 RepID=A0A6A6TUE8_9PEZI|nr:hypothetical protein BT63DRAFT_110073 [Microthyrium microscopicum]